MKNRFLCYVLTAIILLILFSSSACTKSVSTPIPTPTQTTPTPSPAPTPTLSSTLTVKPNPVEEYAKSLGLPDDIVSRLKPLGENGVIDENEIASINYLHSISQAEVVSPEVLKLASSTYRDGVIHSLQTEVADYIMKNGISQNTTKALTYLSYFSGEVQRGLIELGFDDTLVNYLVLNSSLENQEFAKYVIENRLCIQDHKLKDLEKKFLEKPEEYGQALLDDYLSELAQIYPELAEELKKLPELQSTPNNAQVASEGPRKVYLLISSSVYEPIKLRIERWIEDVERTGVQVVAKTITKETPSEIRALLQGMPGLTGCLMVGDIPVVKYEDDYTSEGKSYHEEFPTDLYYMDLDGNWLDTNNNGIFDAHTGNIAPEIWVGRLKASNLPSLGNEVDLLNNYFDKDHLYRIGALTLPNKALMYIDDFNVADVGQPRMTYVDVAQQNGWESILRQVYENTTVITKPEVTTARDYLQRLNEGWSLVRLLVHSGGFGHYFQVNGEWDGEVHSSDIVSADPKAFFYTITSCGDFDYTTPDYIGGCYVFSKSFSLIGVGDSGVHDLLVVEPDQFFPRLKSECFGSAFLHYLQECVKRNARVDSVHNAVMIGDPLLMVVDNGQDSDGDGLTDKYETSVGLDPNKIDTDNNGISDLEEAKLMEFLQYAKVYSIKAVENILGLAYSNNPEVKEAFELMIKGGIPNQSDFSYEVPDWNTELEVLYNLAEQNEFNKDDTLAQAIAMDNGLWITMGDDEVRQAVYKDTNDLLNFFRETNEIQKARGYNQLKDYPLEAKIALTWTGNYAAMSGRPQDLPSFKNDRLPKWAYDWITVSVSELKKMRDEVEKRGWIANDTNNVIANLEWFFYFDKGGKASNSTHWVYEGGDEMITVDGRQTVNHDMSNADFTFDFFLNNGYAFGDCGDETTLVDALSKSWGIATNPVSYGILFEDTMYRHFYNIYFDPNSSSWKAYEKQAGKEGYPSIFDDKQYLPVQFYVNRPPVNQINYLLDTNYTKSGYTGKTVYRDDSYTISTLADLLTKGVPALTMKKWLFYSD